MQLCSTIVSMQQWGMGNRRAECGWLRRNKYWTWAKLLLRRGYNAYKVNELNSERITTLRQHLNYEVRQDLSPVVERHDAILPDIVNDGRQSHRWEAEQVQPYKGCAVASWISKTSPTGFRCRQAFKHCVAGRPPVSGPLHFLWAVSSRA